MHSWSCPWPQLPRRCPNPQRRQRPALSSTGDGTPLRPTPRPSNGPKTSTCLNPVAPPLSHPTSKVASHLPKGQPLCPNPSQPKDAPPAAPRPPRHSPILPVRSLATSPKVSRSAPTPQKQKTRRVRRARSTPDSIDAPRARLRLTSIPTPSTRALRSMLSLFVRGATVGLRGAYGPVSGYGLPEWQGLRDEWLGSPGDGVRGV